MLVCHNLPQYDSVAEDVGLNERPIRHYTMLTAAAVDPMHVMMNIEPAQKSPRCAQNYLRTAQRQNISLQQHYMSIILMCALASAQHKPAAAISQRYVACHQQFAPSGRVCMW